MAPTTTRKLRSDAVGNCHHVIAVAREAFAREGLDVTMREVARRSGFGTATLYRHFPTRDDLVVAVFADRVAACAAVVDAARLDLDPWRGMQAVFAELCQRHAEDRGFTDALLGAAGHRQVFAEELATNVLALGELTERARAAGVMRADVSLTDVRLAVRAVLTVRAPTPAEALARGQRLTALLLRGMRA